MVLGTLTVMADPDPAERGGRQILRRIVQALSLLWAGFWVVGGIGSGLDPTDGTTLAAGLAIALGVGVVPCLPLWLGSLRRFRERRRAARLRARRTAAAHAEHRQRERMERLPPAVRGDWERLEKARHLVQELADGGWIEPSALLEIDRHTERLRSLLEADARTDRLGGEASATLYTQVADLAALLVALADAAVEHQAALMTDAPVPVTLAEARNRLSTTTEAYRDLQQPG